MTTKDLFSAIGAVDEEVLIQAQKKRISPIVWIVAAAAVLLGITLLIHRERPVYHTTLEEKPSWSMNIDVDVLPDSFLLDENEHPHFIVHARVSEVLPDTYLIPEKTLSRQRCRVLRLHIEEALFGTNVPKELYFLLSEQCFTDLTGMDLIIEMDQLGLEDYLLLNATSGQYETFSLMFACGTQSYERDIEANPDPTKASILHALPDILPFKGSKLCWPQNDRWAQAESYFEILSDVGEIPLTANSTLRETKEAFRQMHSSQEAPKVRYADEYNIGIRLTDADTPKEGVFSQIIHQHERKILLCRIIDGFYANECYMYYEDGRIEASDVKFTQEDIAALPDLTPAVEQALTKAPVEGTCRKFVGYYYKTDNGKVFGVVQAHWEINWEKTVTLNLVVTPGGKIHQVTAKGLDAYLKGN